MRKDDIFWLCMIVNILAVILLSFLKPFVHTLPVIVMHIIIKIEMFMQIGLGFYGLWVSTNKELFGLSAKIYAVLYLTYIIIKLPSLYFLNQYFIVVPAMFTPLPFVIVWLVDKSFYRNDKKNSEGISK